MTAVLLGPDGNPATETLPCSRCGTRMTMPTEDAKVARKFYVIIICASCRDTEKLFVALNRYRVRVVVERAVGDDWEGLAGFTADDEALTLRATLHADGGLSDRMRDKWLRMAESADLAEATASPDPDVTP